MYFYPWSRHEPEAPAEGEWDVIVVGTGMGGGFVGLRLAELGQRVLFLERGLVGEAPRARGGRLARLFNPEFRKDALRQRGRWPEGAILRLDGRRRPIMPALGNGPGGSSAIYGTAIERFIRMDFTGDHGAAGRFGELPNRWPVPYDAFLPYYRQAEARLRPHGSRDSFDPDDDTELRTPPPLSGRDQWLFDAWQAAGLKPYHVHAAVDDRPGCTQCLGVVCPRRCKGEGASRGLIPAMDDHGAKLLLGFAVDRLEITGSRITGVVGRMRGEEMTLRGRTVILAAGALATPLILMRSTSEAHPHGVGNDRDMVGRGAIFHNNQTFAVWAGQRLGTVGPQKTFASRALFVRDGERLGSIQSFTSKVQGQHIADYMFDILRQVPLGPFRQIANLGCKVAGKVFARLFGDAALFSTATEDYAYAGNRVVIDPASPSGYAIEYDFRTELLKRSRDLRKATSDALRAAGMRVLFISRTRSLNLSHVAGTCRMGEDPSTSVVDPDLRVWGIDNLHIADSSVLPTCSAMNPSLTVAACALRLAEHLAR